MESKVKAMVVVSHLQEEAQCEEAVLVSGEDIGKHHTLVELLLAEEEEGVVEVAEVAVKEEDIRSIVIQISIITLRIEALFGFIFWLNP